MAGLNIKGKGAYTRQWLDEAIKRKATDKSYNKLVTAAEIASDAITEAAVSGMFGFHNVTGNLFASMGISVVKHDPKTHRYVLSKHFHPYSDFGVKVTRKTLKKGEMYDKDAYYLGDKVKGKPYAGEYGMGNEYGYKTVAAHRDRIRQSSYKGKNRIVSLYYYVTIGYAKYTDAKEGVHYMEVVKDILKLSL